MKDYGVPYTTFETSDRIGGNWAFGNPNGHSSAYRSLHIDTSRQRLCFKDFPMPEHYPSFPHHSDIKEYLDAYAEAFGLLENIEFRNGVAHARRRDGGGWDIDGPGGRDAPSSICWSSRTDTTGTRGWPDFPGTFTGESIHSHHYIDPQTPLDLHGQAHPGRRPRKQRRRHHRRAVVEGTAEPGDVVDTVECVDRAEVHRWQARRHAVRAPRRTCRCPGSARPISDVRPG